MNPCRCVVTFTDSDHIQHEVQVWANTVYDAVAQAMREFRHGSIAADLPASQTEFSIAVHHAPVTHRIKLQQVRRWAGGGGKGPHDVLERKRIQDLLGPEPKQ